jgi:anti-sigma regulatory factor (Ser/Thr protein kinase)
MAAPALTPRVAGMRHVVFFYRDHAERRAQILSFAREGMSGGEAVLIALPGEQARLLGAELGGEPGELLCADLADVGRNPARIIPELRAFVGKHAGQPVRMAAEPVWPGRSAAEACEGIRHEALTNLAFPEPYVTVMCAYDLARHAPSVIAAAGRTHPEHLAGGPSVPLPRASDAWQFPPECDRPLPAPPADAEGLGYRTDLAPVRRLVESHARGTRLAAERVADLILAASEVAANTLGHTGSGGTFQVWHDEEEILCQAHDQGWIADPLAGRVRRGPDGRGHGLFRVNQVCDLVEMRTGRDGTTVRMHMRLADRSRAPQPGWGTGAGALV